MQEIEEHLSYIGKAIRKKRKEKGLRLEDIADENISSSTISSIETAKPFVSKQKVHYLCKKLDINLNELIQERINSFNEEEEFNKLQLSIAESLVMSNQYQEAFPYLRTIDTTASDISLATVLYLKGKCYFLKDNKEKAKSHFHRAIQTINKAPKHHQLYLKKNNIKPCCYNELGRVAFYQSQLVSALEYAQKGINCFYEDGAREHIIYTLKMNKAIYLEQLDRREEASRILDNLWSERHKITYVDVILNVHDNKGKIFLRSKMFNDALKIVEQGIEIARRNRKHEHSAELWSTLGNIYQEMDKMKLAESCLKMALSFQKSSNHKPHLFLNIKRQLGALYLQLNRLDESRALLEEAIKETTEEINAVRYTQTLNTLGKCYHMLNLQKLANETLMNALTLAEKYRLQSEKREILFNLAALYKSTDEKEYYQFLNMMYETEVSLNRGGEL